MKNIISLLALVYSLSTFAQSGWQTQSPQPYPMQDVQMIDVNNIWACGSGDVVVQSTDGGSTWNNFYPGTSGETYWAMDWPDPNTGYIAMSNKKIFRSVDSGITWNEVYTGGSLEFKGIDFIDGNTGWACGSNGDIIMTSNQGASWSGQISNTVNELTSIYFEDPNVGYACGMSGTVVYTIDGGVTWTVSTTGVGDDLFGITGAGAGVVWAVGKNGTAIQSTDQGVSWNLVNIGSVAGATDVFFFDANLGWITTDASPGEIMHTVDGGLTWFNQDQTEPYPLRTIHFADPLIGISAGDNGTLVKTISGGNCTPATATGPVLTPNPCNGQSIGSISHTPTGGIPPYSFLWSHGPTTEDVISLPAGSYTLTITDASGCVWSDTYNLIDPALLVANASGSNTLCFGGVDGTLSSAPIGGASPLAYSWTGGYTSQNVGGVAAGTYTLTVTDANACTAIDAYSVTAPPAITLAPTITQISCAGGSDGEVTMAASGGTPAFGFLWSTAASTATISNLAAGLYQVTATDANGCTGSDIVNINEPPVISLTTSFTMPLCNGGNDATADVTASGGTGASTFLWSTTAAAANITGLTTGIYGVTATDDNACSVSTNVTVTEPAILTATMSGNMNGCPTGAFGNASISTTGGTGTASYVWSNTQTTANLNSLTEGTYTVTATDANGCSVVDNYIVTGNPPFAVTVTVVPPSCVGAADGTMDANMTGGVGNYMWDWGNGQYDMTATGISAGVYTLNYADQNECSAAPYNITVTDPTPVSLTTNVLNHPLCPATSTGNADVVAIGGTGSYTYIWSNSSANATLSNVAAGAYSVTVSDGNNCSAIDSTDLINPLALSGSTSFVTVTCNGYSDGSVNATVSGGTGSISYLWNNASTTNPITGLTAGTYILTATDANGCQLTLNETVLEPISISVNVALTNESCYNAMDATATATASGGNGSYSFLWNTGQVIPNVTGVNAGFYRVTVTDLMGCTGIADSTTTGPTEVSYIGAATDVTCSGGIDGSVNGAGANGVAPYSYMWNNAASSQNIGVLSPGLYSVTVTDMNGCASASLSYIVNNPTPVSGTYTSTDVSCAGANDGTATAIPSGGFSPYTYIWPGSTSPTLTGQAGGSVTCVVTDANGCVFNVLANIFEPSPIAMAVTTSNPTCAGYSDGQSSVSVSGGMGAFTFAWSTGGNSNAEPNLAAGSVSLSITDANLCYIDTIFTLTDPAMLVFTSSVTDANCSQADGSVATTASSGATPYTYFWSDGSTLANPTGIVAGTYDVTVTYGANCTFVSSTTVANIAGPVLTITTTDVSCFGGSDGVLASGYTGGTAPMLYAWSNAALPNSTNTGLPAGTYDLSITDANNCVATISASITEASLLSVNATSTDDHCGQAIGTANATSTGGTGVVTYNWSTGGTGGSITTVVAGTVTVTATDVNGCSALVNVVLADIAGPTSTVSSTDPWCPSATNGTGNISATGGVSPYTYYWANGTSTSSVVGLAAGPLGVTVSDAFGCENINMITITDPANVVAVPSATATTCYGYCDGTITLAISGGTGVYSYLWSDGQSTITANALCDGSYNYSVTDGNGCVTTGSKVVTEPGEVLVSTSSTASTCGNANGSANASAAGGDGNFTFNWGVATGANISGINAGTFILTVTDGNGCIGIGMSAVADTDGPNVVTNSVVNANCGGADGSLAITISGGTAPLSVLWTNGATDEDLENLLAGPYAVIVTDANGCVGGVNEVVGSNGSDAPVVSGTVTLNTNGFTVNDGKAYLYLQRANGNFNLADSTNIVNGEYSMVLLPIGNYLVKAIADDISYPQTIETYHFSTHRWDSAQVVTTGCDQNFAADIEVIDLTPLSGASDISGVVFLGTGGKMGAAGDPVPGVDVTLEQVPGGIVAGDHTGVDGLYHFENVPTGSGLEYIIHVDVPGYDMVETYNINTSNTDTTMTDMNFYIGDTIIYITNTSVGEVSVNNNASLKVYPNPFVSETNIEYTLNKTGDVSVDVINVLGEIVYHEEAKGKSTGTYRLDYQTTNDDRNAGMLFIRLNVNNQNYVVKIIAAK